MSTPPGQFPLSSAPPQQDQPAPVIAPAGQQPAAPPQPASGGTNAYVQTDIDAQVNKLVKDSPLGYLPAAQVPPGTPQPVVAKLSQLRVQKILGQLGQGQVKEQQLPQMVQNGILTPQEGNAIAGIIQKAQAQQQQQQKPPQQGAPMAPPGGAQPSQPNTMMSPAGAGVPSGF
jgi:hypothetical protein